MKAAIVLTLLLAGCAQKQFIWEKPGSSESEYNMAIGQCENQSYSLVGAPQQQRNMVFLSCMKGKGWYTVSK